MLVVAVVGVAVAGEWAAGVAGGADKADLCGEPRKRVWAIKRQDHQAL